MKALTANDAKSGFGRLIDLARTEPVVVVMGECERLKALDQPKMGPARAREGNE